MGVRSIDIKLFFQLEFRKEGSTQDIHLFPAMYKGNGRIILFFAWCIYKTKMVIANFLHTFDLNMNESSLVWLFPKMV